MKQRGIDVFKQKQLSLAKKKADQQAQMDRFSRKPEQTSMDF